jgi:hypothetical protein
MPEISRTEAYAQFHARATEAFVEGGLVCIRLDDGREIRFPAFKNRRLSEATPAELANIEIISNGTGLHWPDLDEDLSILGILEGRLGPA